ncbi:MAG: DUF1549 domain-containing protein, partial [Pirellulaceae bacterium]|nr:DUF1549 domain-containing protein [Pirellulaceae bacterium]
MSVAPIQPMVSGMHDLSGSGAILLVLSAFLLQFVSPSARAEPANSPEPGDSRGPVDYQAEVKPLLRARCYACHGALKQEGGLRLDTAASARQGGDSGPAVEAGSSGDSLLVARVSAQDEAERMPPEGKPLDAAQIALLRRWIDQGAGGPADEQPEEDPRAHWAFQRPVRPQVPLAGAASENPIDALLDAGRQRRNLRPVGEIDRRLLLRRVYLDLVGLPPSQDQMQAFLDDTRPDAWQRVVEQLLASPHYGERWGRHWMDVWRYTDWYGLGEQLRYSQKHIWHWRDWIVESLNEDRGYDQMVREMLAADELAPTDQDALRATGFLARNYFLFNRTTWLDDTIEHTSKAFLGLTMNCTKCHDHKYDPLSQREYYQLRAVFEPYQVRLDQLPGETDLERDGLPRVFDADLQAPTYLHVRGDDKQPDTSQALEPAVPGVLAFEPLQVQPVELPPEAHQPALREYVLRDALRLAERELAVADEEVARAQERVEEARRRAALLAAQPETGSEPASPADDGELLWEDTFAEPKPGLWETGPGMWSYADGKLRQQQTGAERAWLRSRGEHPPDFEARFEFRILGGQQWKSVGLCFDVVDGREKLIYLSGVNPGSKVQVSYRVDGQQVYPPVAKQDRAVELERNYVLRIAVRGTLVNVSVDGEHALAYELPVRREPGRLELIAFDAATEWRRLEVRRLPAGAKLVAAPAPAAGDQTAK